VPDDHHDSLNDGTSIEISHPGTFLTEEAEQSKRTDFFMYPRLPVPLGYQSIYRTPRSYTLFSPEQAIYSISTTNPIFSF
jgi:hypothetical protein